MDTHLTFGQKLLIAVVAGAVVGAVTCLVSHHMTEAAVKANKRKAINA